MQFGVFEVYYDHHEAFASQGGSASIGTTESGIMYFLSPLVAMAVQRWPQYRRRASCCGLALMVAGLVAASFSNSVSGLIGTQGVMYALGGLAAYFPAMSLVTEWFVRRRGLAFGIMWAGTGIAGTVLPFLLQWLLDSYGYRTTLRVWAVALAILASCCIYLIKPRLPITTASSFRPVDVSFMKHSQFWIFQTGNVLQSLGFFLPTLYIPSFALAIGLPSFAGPLALALFNVAFAFGAVLIGTLVDRFHVTVAILTCTIGQMVSIFIFWGLTSSQAMLYTFAMLFGCFGGAFSCTWSGCANEMQRSEKNGNVDVSMVVALLAAGKGIGAVISGPLSERLLTLDTWKGHAGLGRC
jgi:MFS family permease